MAEHAKPSGVAEAPTQAEIVDFLRSKSDFDVADAFTQWVRMSETLAHNLTVLSKHHDCSGDCEHYVRESLGCAGTSLLALAEMCGVDLGEAMGESFLALRVAL